VKNPKLAGIFDHSRLWFQTEATYRKPKTLRRYG